MNQNKFAEKIRTQVQSYLTPKNFNNPQPIRTIRDQQPIPPSSQLQRKPSEISRTPQKPQQNIMINQTVTTPVNLNVATSNGISNLPKQPAKPMKTGILTTFQSDTLVINNQKLVGNGLVNGSNSVCLKLPFKKKQISFQIIQNGQFRFKFQIKNEGTKIQITDNGINVICKKMAQYKNISKQKKGPSWVLGAVISNPNTQRDKQNVLTSTFPKQMLQRNNNPQSKPTLIDRLLQQDFLVMKQGKSLQMLKITPGEFSKDDDPAKGGEGEDENQQKIQFKVLTKQDMKQIEKFKRNLSQMKQEDKVTILTDVFKIKKQFDDGTKKLKCPIFTCAKVYQTVTQLKTHIKKHPQLSKNGIQINQTGGFQYSQKALDFALIMGKIYPNQMKNIIKMMKHKGPYDG